jgi:hypothetical protein
VAGSLLVSLAAFLVLWFGEVQGFVPWDPAFYMATAASLAKDGDAVLADDLVGMEAGPTLLEKALCYQNANGTVRNPFPLGPSLIQAPFYFLGRMLSPPAVRSRAGWPAASLLLLSLGAMAATAFLLGFLERWFRRLGLSWPTSVLAAAAALLGTPVAVYSVHLYTMAHLPSAVAACMLTVLCLELSRNPKPMPAFLTGLALGASILMRWQDGVLGILVLAALLLAWPKLPELRRGRRLLLLAVALGAGAGLLLWPQWTALLRGQGAFSMSRHYGSFMHWSDPRPLPFFTSGIAGLLPWCPLLALGLAGLLLPWRCRLPRAWRWAFLLIAGAEIYLSAAAMDWWGGASFGPRRLASLLPLVAVGLANLVLQSRAPAFRRMVRGVLILGCLWGVLAMHLFLSDVRDLRLLTTGSPSIWTAEVGDDLPAADPAILHSPFGSLPERLAGFHGARDPAAPARPPAPILPIFALGLALMILTQLALERSKGSWGPRLWAWSLLALALVAQVRLSWAEPWSPTQAGRLKELCEELRDPAASARRGAANAAQPARDEPAAEFLAVWGKLSRGKQSDRAEPTEATLQSLAERGLPAAALLLQDLRHNHVEGRTWLARGEGKWLSVPAGGLRRPRIYRAPADRLVELSFELQGLPASSRAIPAGAIPLLRLSVSGEAVARLHREGSTLIFEAWQRRFTYPLPPGLARIPLRLRWTPEPELLLEVGGETFRAMPAAEASPLPAVGGEWSLEFRFAYAAARPSRQAPPPQALWNLLLVAEEMPPPAGRAP